MTSTVTIKDKDLQVKTWIEVTDNWGIEVVREIEPTAKELSNIRSGVLWGEKSGSVLVQEDRDCLVHWKLK